MREMKFRAFSKEYGMSMPFKMGAVNVIFGGYEKGTWISLANLKLEGASILQYTGIKDKNNHEIFEGDILKITCHFELRKGVEIDEVIWWENGAWNCSDWCLFELIQNSKNGEQEFEIIGNKYEHPEMARSYT